MKLLLLNYEFPPLGGGASKATFHTAIELVKLGHSVDVLTSHSAKQPLEELIKGIRVIRVPSWRRGIHDCGLLGAFSFVFFAFFKLRRLLRQNNYDLLHYYFSLPTGILSFYSHGIRRQPYIVSLRGSDVPGYDTSRRVLQVLHWLLLPINRYIWRKAKSVIALSKNFRELALQIAPNQPIAVIYNGIDIQLFASCRRNIGYDSEVRLLCVSRLIERKGLSYLIAAIYKLTHYRIQLDIVGTGDRERTIRSQVKELGLENRIQFLGYIPQQELSTVYNRANIFVLPTLAESFGMVLLEAMSCGLPIIASNIGGVPEIVTDGENGILVAPANVDDLVHAIIKLVNDPELCAQMRKNNLSKVQSSFTWPRIAQAYQKIYEESLR